MVRISSILKTICFLFLTFVVVIVVLLYFVYYKPFPGEALRFTYF